MSAQRQQQYRHTSTLLQYSILPSLIFYYSFSSNLKSKYLDIKNSFSNSNEYLAVVKSDGLWIKETLDNSIFFIHAEKFNKNILKSVTITETDKYYRNKSTIKSETANITSKNWYLEDVNIIEKNGIKKYFKSFIYNSSFNGETDILIFSTPKLSKILRSNLCNNVAFV